MGTNAVRRTFQACEQYIGPTVKRIVQPLISSGDDAGRGASVMRVSSRKVIIDGIEYTTERHHLIPWDNSEFDHASHRLIQRAGVNIKNYGRNIVEVANHRGGHTRQYNEQVQLILDKHYNAVVNGTRTAKQALDDAIVEIQNEIANKNLNPYNSKEVYINMGGNVWK